MARKHGKKKKKSRKSDLNNQEPTELVNAPHSFVFYRGNVGDTIADLTRDFRKIMEPYTASSLKARKANNIKDFLSVAGLLHVSHMTIFTATELGSYLKIAKVPRGPTLYFKVVNFSLARDVISSLKKQLVFQQQFEHPPLAILNNFSGSSNQIALMSSLLQNMFPSFNVTQLNLNNVRRCVLFNYNAEKDEVDVRHYAIKVVPVGLSKGVKKIVQSKVPDLSRFDDISEFITKSEVLSESEAEDDPASHVTLPQNVSSRGNIASAQSSIRLVEQGPRLTLQLLKIEDGFMAGQVLYHKNITKTQEEENEIMKKRVEKRRLKEQRKRIQEDNVRRKEKEKEEHKKKSLAGMKAKITKEQQDNEEDDDDAEWYKKEVGKEPEHDLFDKKEKGFKRKRAHQGNDNNAKKAKFSGKNNKISNTKNHRNVKNKKNHTVPRVKGTFFRNKKN